MDLLRSLVVKKDTAAVDREKWLSELRGIKNDLDANEMLFNMTSDFDLTDYVIHQRTALEARYSYLIRLIRTYDEATSSFESESNVISQDV